MAPSNAPFPAKPWSAIRQRLLDTIARDPITSGRTVTFLPKDDVRGHAYDAMALVAGAYDWGSATAAMLFDETAAMVRPFFHASDDAPIAFTSGGSESNILALKAARDWARAARPNVVRPEIVMSRATHSCHSKAAQLLGLAERRVGLTADNRADVAAMSTAIGPDTIAVVASYPTDSHGMCDDVSAIAALAERNGLWCHVDASFGGFVAPFLKELGEPLPDFDFRLSGVRSIAADLHKYGYAPTGISTVLLRDPSLGTYLRFRFDGWDGPAMDSDRIAGTRSFDTLAGAWATLQEIGWDGFRARAAAMRENTQRFLDRLRRIEGLELLNRPEIGIVHLKITGSEAGALGAALRQRGHRPYVTTAPAGVILCVGPELREDVLETFVRDISDARRATTA